MIETNIKQYHVGGVVFDKGLSMDLLWCIKAREKVILCCILGE